MDWRAEVLDQLDFYWTMWRPGLDGLTDEEYFWEPVPDCWSLRRVDDGWAMDFAFPEPVPPPFTTIAWRLGHISGHVFAMRANNHFGDASYRMDAPGYPGSAAAALAYLDEQKTLWRNGIGSLDVEGWETPVGPAEGPFADRSYAALALHLNRELFHHGAEVSLLRDLYRATAGRSLA
ncbi:DinB family protein [Saccharopolyspora spinosa]|uniref:DinB family protein n=1 Tax=Saccharopolyspora spinosa TaxID=60894 RepID=A0A2N3XXW4_SACSN|nr:DinB family protein [Saccharopolyspora spinosa]PKW15516.1 DinB family protein [Saccharopolyspora spinosa]